MDYYQWYDFMIGTFPILASKGKFSKDGRAWKDFSNSSEIEQDCTMEAHRELLKERSGYSSEGCKKRRNK